MSGSNGSRATVPTPTRIDDVKIVDVRFNLLEPPAQVLRYREDWPPRRNIPALVRIVADNGVEGHCLRGWLPPGMLRDAAPKLKRVLVGRDPFDSNAISYDLTDKLQRLDWITSVVDIALWDLVGKLLDTPIHKVLGGARDRIRAYASTISYDTVEEYIDLALQCREQGFNAFKVHAFGVPEKDIEVCTALREALGDSMDLMHDPVNAYDRRGAHEVAAALTDLGFHWFEAPIADADLIGLQDLTRRHPIPIAAAESVRDGLRAQPHYLESGAIDSSRSIGDWVGGITALRKIAAVCDAFNICFEPHSYGTTHIQAAHLGIMLSNHNCEFFESPVPQGIFDFGMADVIRVDPDGMVTGPTKPGLGYEVDWDEIRALTVEELSVVSA